MGRKPGPTTKGSDQVLSELSTDAVHAIRDAYQAAGMKGDARPAPGSELAVKVWAIIKADAGDAETLARWDSLLQTRD
jgi:hypothetical protein